MAEHIRAWAEAEDDARNYRTAFESAEERIDELERQLAERDEQLRTLRDAHAEVLGMAENITKHCYQPGKLQCVACSNSQELIADIARAALATSDRDEYKKVKA